jgi:hypothetical protein
MTATPSQRHHRGQGRHRQADADLLPHRDRLGSPNKAGQGHDCTARRWARTKSPLRARSIGWTRPVRDSGRHRAAWDARPSAGAARREKRRGASALRLRRKPPRTGRRIHAPHEGRTLPDNSIRSAQRHAGEIQRQGREHRHPQGLAELHRSIRARRCRNCWAVRPTWPVPT